MIRQDDVLPAPPQREPTHAQTHMPTQLPAQTTVPTRQPSSVHAEYGKRNGQVTRTQQPLDPQGRMIAARPSEDDQLEIPAFLRRQSN
jgi:cell division protein FtsZ